MFNYVFQSPKNKIITPDYVLTFLSNFFTHGLVGLILGASLDYMSKIVARTFILADGKEEGEDRKRLLLFSLGAIQLFVNGLVLFSLTLILPPSVYNRWQETLSGLAFPTLFFGIQVNMFTNIRALLE